MDLRQLCGCAVLLFGGLWLMNQRQMSYRKLGIALVWVASAAGAYVLSDSLVLASTMLLAGLFLPVWEIVFVLRRLRVPRHRGLIDAHPPRDASRELDEISAELRDAGFELLDECKLSPSDHDQYYRIFDRGDGRVQATIGYIAQGAIGFHFLAFGSQSPDGRRWVTWDYPLTYGLSMPPNFALYRVLSCENVAELYQSHLDFLAANDLKESDIVMGEKTPKAARDRLEQALNQQIEHNISQGYLEPASKSNDENFSYSWRGTFYVAGQILRDLLF